MGLPDPLDFGDPLSQEDLPGLTWLLPQHVPWAHTFPFLDLGLPMQWCC